MNGGGLGWGGGGGGRHLWSSRDAAAAAGPPGFGCARRALSWAERALTEVAARGKSVGLHMSFPSALQIKGTESDWTESARPCARCRPTEMGVLCSLGPFCT